MHKENYPFYVYLYSVISQGLIGGWPGSEQTWDYRWVQGVQCRIDESAELKFVQFKSLNFQLDLRARHSDSRFRGGPKCIPHPV